MEGELVIHNRNLPRANHCRAILITYPPSHLAKSVLFRLPPE